MSSSLWPNLSGVTPPRGMLEMLNELAGDLVHHTNGKIEFYVDTLGIKNSGAIRHVRHNCYLRVPTTGYMHLLFRVTTPIASPWPATAATPEGDSFPQITNETELRDVIRGILQRRRTTEIILYLLNTVP